MIFVHRDPEPTEDIAKALRRRVNGTGKTEIEVARDYYNATPPPTTCYPFVRYKTEKVASALDRLFKKKCGYCEITYDAPGARNIDHYRPKGKVNECDGHGGYWWLAATWSNLIPSCLACNQTRSHTIFNPHMSLEEIARLQYVEGTVSTGKGNAFPLRDGTVWARNEGRIDAEDPLLINPSVRRPENHLEWVFHWEPGKYIWESDWVYPQILPRMDTGAEDIYGKASVAIYGLNRLSLFKERVSRLEPLRILSISLVESIKDLAISAKDQEECLKARINDRWRRLVDFRRDEHAFSAMNAAFVAILQSEIKRMESDFNRAGK